MEKELSACLDSPLLLHLYSLESDRNIADAIGRVVALTETRNLYYFYDVIKTWQKHADEEEFQGFEKTLTPGEIKWHYAKNEIGIMEKKILPKMNKIYVERLMKILKKFSEKCTFGRLGDTFVQDSICAEIAPEVFASMGSSEAPYAKAKSHYGDDMNDTVNDLIRTPPADRLTRTLWKTSENTTDFVFAACLLWEMMGQEKLAKLLKNHEMSIYKYRKDTIPHLCVLENKPCMMWGETIFEVEDDTDYSAVVLCFHWIRCAALVGDISAKSVQCAVQTPSKLSARDPIYSFI